LIEVHRFFSRGPGPRVLLLGGVHGDEKAGVLALERLAAEFASGRLSLARGQLTIAPRVNAEAVARGVHFVDENLNRIVFLRSGDTVKMQKVETGIQDTAHIEIKSGVKAGDEVVSGSFAVITRTLKDGMKVRIEPPKKDAKK